MTGTLYVVRTTSAPQAAAMAQVLAEAGKVPSSIEGDGHKVLYWYVWASDLDALYGASQALLGRTQSPAGLIALMGDLGAKAHHNRAVS